MSALSVVRIASYLEYCAVSLLGRVFGVPFIVRYLRNPNPENSVRLLRAYGAQIGNGTTVKGSLYIDNATRDRDASGDFSHLSVGHNCYLGEGVFLDLAGPVVLEDNVVVAGRAAILTHSECGRSAVLNQAFPRRRAPVIVRAGAWIGFGATILCGVTVGECAVIAAGSLLIGDAEAAFVYTGAPAQPKKSIHNLVS